MLNITRSKYENYKEKNLQMVLNISNFEFNENMNNLNGKENLAISPILFSIYRFDLINHLGRVTIVINVRQEDGEYKLLKILHGSIEQIFRESLRNGWIPYDSEWKQLLNISI